jgi:hypothetical protein
MSISLEVTVGFSVFKQQLSKACLTAVCRISTYFGIKVLTNSNQHQISFHQTHAEFWGL